MLRCSRVFRLSHILFVFSGSSESRLLQLGSLLVRVIVVDFICLFLYFEQAFRPVSLHFVRDFVTVGVFVYVSSCPRDRSSPVVAGRSKGFSDVSVLVALTRGQ